MTKRVTGHHEKEVEKVRGGWLTAALVLIIIRNSVAAIWIFTLGNINDVTDSSTLVILLAALLVLVAFTDVISGVAMWRWKKWGLYLFAISTIVGIALHTVLISPFAAFHDIIGPAILAYILQTQNKYRFFE